MPHFRIRICIVRQPGSPCFVAVMNEKKQAITVLSAVLLTLTGLFLYHVQQLESRISDLMIEGDARELNSTAQTLQRYSYAKYSDRIKNLLLSSPGIVAAFAEQDRSRLLAKAETKYESLKRENPYFHVMQFHLPDGTVFLRMQQPDLFGDNLAAERPMVAAVHREQRSISGFEFGREGLLYWVVNPIFMQGRYVGALELGIRAEEMVEAIEENLKANIISYFRADQWEKAAHPNVQPMAKVGDFVFNEENAPIVKLLPPAFYQEEHDKIVEYGDRNYRVHNHKIFQDYKNQSLGGLVLLQDISPAIARKQAFFWKAALAGLLLFLVAASVLYLSFERILSSLLDEIGVRKQKEAELKEREGQVRLLLNSTAEGIFGLDNDGKCTFVNKSCLTLLGYEHESELLGSAIHDLIHYRRPDGSEFPMAECPMCRSFHGGDEVAVDDEVLWRKDGRAVPVEYHAYPIWQGGHLLGSVVTFSDISRRKQAEEDKGRLAAAIEHAADEIIITDLDGVIGYVNPAFERVTGYSRDEAVGMTPRVLKSGKHNKEYYQDLWGTIRAGKVWSNRIINRTKSGVLIEEDATISPIFDAAERAIGYVAVKRDITEKVKMEERLRQANKMESLGTLAGAIAHDFNNILSGIIGFASLSLMEVEPDGRVAESLNGILRASGTATELVKQILAFSRKGSTEFKPVAIQDVAKDVVKLLRCTMPKKIEIDVSIEGDCGLVWGNASQIHQVLMNLGTNAYHAMREKGGVLTVQVNELLQAEVGHGVGAVGSRFVELQISDTGGGIASEDLAHIFEPYFTTKKEGEGTGLGLSTVREIVKSHNGEIAVQSEPGCGATFTLTFPVCEKQGAALDLGVISTALPELRGHILLVDDASINVMLAQEILQSAGCKVTGLTDSIEALELFRKKPDGFDLVVTDQVMPELTGDAMAREMLKIRPDIPIIMVTGNENASEDAQLSRCGIREFIEKPISVKGLLAGAGRALSSNGDQ